MIDRFIPARALRPWLAAGVIACNERPQPPAADLAATAVAAPSEPSSPSSPPRPSPAEGKNAAESPPAPDTASWKVHRGAFHGVSFRYPSSYVGRVETYRRGQDIFALIADHGDDASRAWAAGKNPFEDGQMQITISVGKKQMPDKTLTEWARMLLARQPELELEPLQVAGLNAVAYATDGLWQGRTVLIELPDHIVDAHVDFNSPDDTIRKDFDRILATLEPGAP